MPRRALGISMRRRSWARHSVLELLWVDFRTRLKYVQVLLSNSLTEQLSMSKDKVPIISLLPLYIFPASSTCSPLQNCLSTRGAHYDFRVLCNQIRLRPKDRADFFLQSNLGSSLNLVEQRGRESKENGIAALRI